MTNRIWDGVAPSKSPDIFERLSKAKERFSKKATQLQEVIDNPERPWNKQEIEELKSVSAEHEQIKTDAESVDEHLNEIPKLLNQELNDNLSLASKHEKNIGKKLQEIEKHLAQYHDLLESLTKEDVNPSEQEQLWIIKANKQVDELNVLKKGLLLELDELHAEQSKCINVVPIAMAKLENLLTSESVVTMGKIPQDVSFLKNAMRDTLYEMRFLKESLASITTEIRSVFTSISNYFERISETLAKTTTCLNESEQLLAEYPKPASEATLK